MVSVRPRRTPPAHDGTASNRAARGSDTTVTTPAAELRGTSARSDARRSPDGRTGLRTGMSHTPQTKCAVVHIVNSLRVSNASRRTVSASALRQLTGGQCRGVHSSRWHRRRACRSIQDEQPCRTESAHELDAASLYTSRQRSTAASSAVRSIPHDTSVCAIRRAEPPRVPYRCCANCVLTSRRTGFDPEAQLTQLCQAREDVPRGCPASPAEASLRGLGATAGGLRRIGFQCLTRSSTTPRKRAHRSRHRPHQRWRSFATAPRT